MSFTSSSWSRHAVALTLAAALLSALTMGSRSSLGLFVGPVNTATAFGVATVSFAFAASHLAWGAAQPLLGLAALRFGAAQVLAAGAACTALGSVLVAFAPGVAGFTAAMLLVGVAVAAAGSAPLLMQLVAQGVAPRQRGLALGVVSAGGSVGQLLLAPASAVAITSLGWQGAMIALGVLALAALPLTRVFRAPPADTRDAAAADARSGNAVTPAAQRDVQRGNARQELRSALRSTDYWCLTAGFFVCGFHVTFLTTHMPGVVELCGFSAAFAGVWLAIVGACNIGGSLGAGWLMQHVPMKTILGALYALRALGVALFLLLPKTEAVLLGFALWMGLTYMATLPPTTGLIARLYGARHVGVLFGLTMAIHQVGSFLGAWLGGLEREAHGDYTWTWLAGIALSLAAAMVHVPIRERRAAAPPFSPWSPAPAR